MESGQVPLGGTWIITIIMVIVASWIVFKYLVPAICLVVAGYLWFIQKRCGQENIRSWKRLNTGVKID